MGVVVRWPLTSCSLTMSVGTEIEMEDGMMEKFRLKREGEEGEEGRGRSE